jgi:hypothetical protein
MIKMFETFVAFFHSILLLFSLLVKKGLWGGYPILCFPKSREEVLGGCSIFILIKIGEKMACIFFLKIQVN